MQEHVHTPIGDTLPGEKLPKGSPLRRRSNDLDRLTAGYLEEIQRARQVEAWNGGTRGVKAVAQARAVFIHVPKGSAPMRRADIAQHLSVMRFAKAEAMQQVEAIDREAVC